MTPEAREALRLAQRLHEANPALSGFCSFPSDIFEQDKEAYDIPAAQKFMNDARISEPSAYADFVEALKAFGPQAIWRETYKDTEIGELFREEFGCYELIGHDGPFRSQMMRGFIVYMPPGLWYPYHKHPSQELYFVLAGDADFYVEHDCERLSAGDKAFHKSNIPHALETKDSPILAWVLWRGPDFDAWPVLCEADGS